jgi:hypothetical protein
VPIGVAIVPKGPKGELWVADPQDSRAEEFNSAGEYIRSTEGGALVEPNFVAVATNGNVWLTDPRATNLKEFSSEGTFIGPTLPLGGEPVGVAVASDGSLEVTDRYHSVVDELSSTGEYLSQFGAEGSGTGQLSGPQGLSIDGSDKLWVTDSRNNRVEAFSSTGGYITQFGSGVFSDPGAVAVASGVAYVTDYENSRVERWEIWESLPTVVTLAASSVAQTSATLNATVNPNGAKVSECSLEYGTSNSYGSSAPCTPSPGSGTSPVAVSASVTGLTSGTTYHFRVSATNAGGTSNGSDQTFNTP